MSIFHFKTLYLLFFPGSFAFTNEQLYQNQFNFCWKKTVDSREENQTLCCLSGRIKFDGLSYCKNDTSVCASNAVCDASECCNGTDQHYFNSSQALAVYTVCSYETNCSINWEDKAFIPPGYQGHVNSIANYTCIEVTVSHTTLPTSTTDRTNGVTAAELSSPEETSTTTTTAEAPTSATSTAISTHNSSITASWDDSMVVKMCEDNVMTGGQVELVLDGKKPGVVSSGPAKCECSLLIEPTNGSWFVDVTDLRFAKPSDSSCSTAMLNISGLSVGKCSAGQFQHKGTFMFDSGYSNKLSIEHLFEFGVEDIPSMIWITIRGNSNSITVNCYSIETIHSVTYYTYSTPRQATSSTHPTSCTKITTQDDREHFSATKAAETTSTTITMGPVTNTTVSEISVQHGDSTLIKVNSHASQTIHKETSYTSQLQTTPSSLYMSWTKLPTTQGDRTLYSLSTVTDNTGKTKTDGMVTNTSVSGTRADNDDMVLIIELVASIAGGVVIIISVIFAALWIRKIQNKALKTSNTDRNGLTSCMTASNTMESLKLNSEIYASLDKSGQVNSEYDQLKHEYINTTNVGVEGGNIMPNAVNISAV